MAVSVGVAGGTPVIRWLYLWWVAAALGVMFAAMASDSLWFLNFVHVMAGVL